MITSRSNPALRALRRARRERGATAVLEGPDLVAEAVAAGIGLDAVLATPEFLDGAEARRLAPRLATPPRVVAARLLGELADADAPRGIVALARLPRPAVSGLPAAGGVHLYLDGVQDPGNLGALARVAEAAGARGLALAPGSAHPNHPRALRASAGSLLRLPTAVGVEPAALVRHLESRRRLWVALDPHHGVPLWRAELPADLVLALGAEGPGLSAAAAERADLRLRIPLAPPVESLNVAVAAGIVLFELRRRGEGG